MSNSKNGSMTTVNYKLIVTQKITLPQKSTSQDKGKISRIIMNFFANRK